MPKADFEIGTDVMPSDAARVIRPDAVVVDSGRAFRRQVAFWIAAAVVLLLFLLMFRSILLPFVAGMVLAYFLDPLADRLERLGLSRIVATVVILVGFVVSFILLLALIVPVLGTQLIGFASDVPGYIAALQERISSFKPGWLQKTLGVDSKQLRDGLSSLVGEGAGFVTTLFASLWSSGKAIIDIAGLFVVTPVVVFYMLLDWDRMVAKIDGWIPRNHVLTVRELAVEINRATAGFVRGQGTLCLILGVYYAIGLTLVGLNFGLLIGLIAGIISFIPYVGSLTGLVLALGVAFVQFWPDWPWIIVVAVVFFTGQFVEGNILQPKLVGQSVGLHPVWLMFALVAFGYLFGFVGLLIAVPAAAAIGVLARFAISRYLASPLYRGTRDITLMER